jgi:2-alkyl-3-oxoalkanoate reductase
VDETVPYPESYMCEYSRSKAIAEMLVIDANGKDLATVSIRPHLIWGPGDPHLVPRILAKSDSGRLIRVGRGENKVDIIYIDNAVSAHLKAWDALEIGNPLAGKVYFVSDGEPVKLWDWIDKLLIKTGRPPVSRSISYRTAVKLGHFFEGIYNFCGIKVEPPMTRFMASQLATSHYFNITRARNDFGYEPVVSPDEGLNRLIQTAPVKC